MSISVKAEIARVRGKQKEIAEAIGIHPVTFNRKLNADTLTLKEAEDVFSYIGLELLLSQKNLPLIVNK